MNPSDSSHNPSAYVRGGATWFGFFLVAVQVYLFVLQGNVNPFLQAEFGLSYGEVSLHSMAVAIGVIITGLFGRVVTRPLGRRYSLWLGGAGMAASTLLLCIAPSPWVSIGSCLLLGLTGSIAGATVPAIMADLHGERRDRALAEQSIIAYALALLGPLGMGLSVSYGFGWRPAVLVAGIFALALLVIFRGTPIPEGTPRPAGQRHPLPASFWAYWALLTFTCAMEFSVLLWAPTFLQQVVGFSVAAAASVAAAFFIGVLGGRMALRILLQHFAPMSILYCAFAAGLAGFALYWLVSTPVAATIGIFLIGLCVAPMYPMSMAMGIGAARGANDMAAVRLVLGQGLAILLAPAALGALADAAGLHTAHLVVLGLGLAGLLSLIAAPVLERRETAKARA